MGASSSGRCGEDREKLAPMGRSYRRQVEASIWIMLGMPLPCM